MTWCRCTCAASIFIQGSTVVHDQKSDTPTSRCTMHVYDEQLPIERKGTLKLIKQNQRYSHKCVNFRFCPTPDITTIPGIPNLIDIVPKNFLILPLFKCLHRHTSEIPISPHSKFISIPPMLSFTLVFCNRTELLYFSSFMLSETTVIRKC